MEWKAWAATAVVIPAAEWAAAVVAAVISNAFKQAGGLDITGAPVLI
jgi:hypothetical protein